MQTDLFSKPVMKPRKVTLEIHGKIPSYKNNKMLIRPSAKALMSAIMTGDLKGARALIHAYLKKPIVMITKPEYQRTMETMIASIESQLLSVSQTASGQIYPASLTLSWIALSVPADDCWTKLPKIVIEAELCKPGEEGATIVIERL